MFPFLLLYPKIPGNCQSNLYNKCVVKLYDIQVKVKLK